MESDSLIGRQLGAYLIQAKLGEGGMANVYKAYHLRLQRDVALKVILPQIADQPGFQIRFEREAQVIASLEHRNIVTVYDFGESGNLMYLVMQYVGGGTLRDKLRSAQPLEPLRATQYTLQMARALHHAHLHGIVHRDVKPQNMLVSTADHNELLLSDFGIAKLFDSHQEGALTPLTSESMGSNHSLTNVGQMVGTAEYMAPEQINMEPVDARTDIYALGIVLYQMLTGQVPFQSSSTLGLLYQQVYTVPPPIRELNPTVPQILASITAKALEKAPEARFQSAEEMAQALEAVRIPSTNPFPSSNLLAYPPQSLPTPVTASSYSQQPIPGAASVSGLFTRTTTAGRDGRMAPIPSRARSKFLVTSIMVALVLLLLLVSGTWHPFLPRLSGRQSTTAQGSTLAKPFTETFQDDQRNWTVGKENGLTASFPSNHKYPLATDSTVTKTSYFFPHPDPLAVGMLPDHFTLIVQIVQNMGDTSVFYGLSFYFKEDSNGKVYSYAFVIDGSGDFRVWKFDPNAKVNPIPLASGQLPSSFQGGLNHMNTLQVSVQRGTFSFKVNDLVLQVGSRSTDTAITETSFKDGQQALLVSGPNSQFTVSLVQLTIP